MAYMLSRGSNGDLAIKFNDKRKFAKVLKKQIEENESPGCHVVVSISVEPEYNYEQEYKKIYRRKSLKDRGNDFKKEIGILKAILGWG